MQFEPFPKLETPRLELLKPSFKEWPVILFLRSDTQVNQYVKRPLAETKEKSMDFIEKVLINMTEGKLVNWFIYLKVDQKMIGSICLWNFSEDRKTAEIGYDLNPKFWGKGIMNEAMQKVIDYGFGKLSLNKIEAYTSYENAASSGLLSKNGFQLNEDKRDSDNPDNKIFELRKD